MPDLQPAFDYAALPAADRQFLKDKVGVIRHIARQCGESVLHIGRHLTEVRERIRGRFLEWVHAEFSWHRSSVYRMMDAAEHFGAISQIGKQFDASALFVLSEPKCPPAAREMAVEMAKDGQHVTHRDARDIIDAVRRGDDPPAKNARPAARRPKEETHPDAEPDDLFSDYKTLWLAFKKIATTNNLAAFSWEPYCIDDDHDEVKADPETHLQKAHFKLDLYPHSAARPKSFASTTYLETLILEAADAHPKRVCRDDKGGGCGRLLRLYEDFGSKKGNKFNRSRTCKDCEVKRVGVAKERKAKARAATPRCERTGPTPSSRRAGPARGSNTVSGSRDNTRS